MHTLLGTIPARPAERRAASRFQPTFGTVCRLDRSPARRGVGLVWDISATGVSMLMAHPPEAGSVLPAELSVEAEGKTLPVSLRVVHVRTVSTGDYFVGAHFGHPLSSDEISPFVTPVLGGPLPTDQAN